jgi:hypothetical protein
LISDIDIEEAPQTFWDGFNVFQSTLTGSLSGNCTTFTSSPLNPTSRNNFSDEPTGITINNSNNRIYVSDDNANRIFEIVPGLDGTYCTSDDTVTYVPIGIAPFNITDAEDLAYGQGKLYITSGGDGSKSIYEYNLGANGVLGGGDDSSSTLPSFGTSALGFTDVEGIAYNSAANTLYILSTHGTDTYLGETTTSGTLLRAYDLSYLGYLGSVRRSGLTIAPASGDPSTNNIYIVSRGEDNANTSNFNDGKIWEIDITNPVMPDLIFKDGFESGDLSAWTLATTNGGNLNVNASAALFGSFGMRAQINNTTSMDVMDEKPTLESRYRARFYFDPNSIVMTSGDTHIIFQAYSYSPYTEAHSTAFRLDFRYSSGAYQVRPVILSDSTATTNGSFFTITDSSHFIEVDWSAATAIGANNGYLKLWVDGNPVQNLTGIDNDTLRTDRVRFGPTGGLDSGTNGIYFFDAFESRRQCYIGAVGDVIVPTVASVARADTNPTGAASVNYTVTFSECVTGVDVTDFTLTTTGVSGASVSGVSGSGDTYMVTVNTGVDSGTIRLDVLDNDSIIDLDSNSLSGGFTSGEVYTIEKIAPTVTSVTRADADPTAASSVNYTVIFSEAVTGVNAADFTLTTTGVSGASVSGVSGSGDTYTVTVNTGTRNGTIRLDVLDDNSIKDLSGNSLENSFTSGEVYTVLKGSDVEVKIGSSTLGNFHIPFQASDRPSFSGIDNGPARLLSTNSIPIITALRVIWKEPGFRASYSEMMGLPKEQLSTEYWFPWYNNAVPASMDQGFRIANVDSVSRTIQVWVGTTQLESFTLGAGASIRKSYNVDNGPIRILCFDCTGSGKIIAAMRVIWQEPGVRFSYSEMMGLPKEQLSDEYWFPWYNNAVPASMDQGFRIANVSSTESNTVEVWVGSTKLDTLSLNPGASTRVGYNVDNGPIRILCTTCTNTGDDKIIAALRVIWKEPGFRASYSEMMGLPNEQLSDEYWFPWYNNAVPASMDQGFRIANVSSTESNTVEVWVGNTKLDTITLGAGASTRVGYNVDNGPIRIVCTTCTNSNYDQILAALRVIWKEPGFRASYSEMMGLPAQALSTEYWFPWYNFAAPNSMDQGFRVAVP